jgi:hypothetical protein
MLAARVEPKNGLYRNNLCRALSIGVVISGIGPDRRSQPMRFNALGLAAG